MECDFYQLNDAEDIIGLYIKLREIKDVTHLCKLIKFKALFNKIS